VAAAIMKQERTGGKLLRILVVGRFPIRRYTRDLAEFLWRYEGGLRFAAACVQSAV
jgi:hypothetical protein